VELHQRLNNRTNSSKYKKKLTKLYYQAKRQRKVLSLRVLDYFANERLQKMKSSITNLKKIELTYPEKTFQKLVEHKISTLDKLVEQGNDVLEVGSGTGIISSYKILNEAYTHVGKELAGFTPKGKSATYIKGFKAQMGAVSKQMIDAAKRYKEEAIRSISKNTILSKQNIFFQNNSFPVNYFEDGGVVIMDRGGR
ncbi:MAG: hypothetical protein OEW87_11460, partial [Flavobacteriaceae bacterium]|nr:hypothetical protein [Flavobacteriaceae bacterium]